MVERFPANVVKEQKGTGMNIGAVLKSFIYIVSASLLYPVLFLLSILVLWTLAAAGGFFAEWLERVKLDTYDMGRLAKALRNNDLGSVVSHRAMEYAKVCKDLLAKQGVPDELEMENLLQEHIVGLWKSLDRTRMMVRIGPSLGLIGTLIPMGTGLAALGQGDLTRLSGDLIIAFTTTVVGLSIGISAYFFYTIKRRWVEKDIKDIRVITDLLVGDPTLGEVQ